MHTGDGSQAGQSRCGDGGSRGTSKTACLTCDEPRGGEAARASRGCHQSVMKACSTHLPIPADMQVCKVGLYSFGVKSCADDSLIFCVLALDTCTARLVRSSRYHQSKAGSWPTVEC